MAQATSTPQDQSYNTPSHNATISTIAYSHGGSQYVDPKKHEMAVAYRNEKSRAQMNSFTYGDGRIPFFIAIGCFGVGFLMFVIGATITGLYHTGRVVLGRDGSFIGPMILVLGLLFCALGAYFIYRAHIKSSQSRAKTKFKSEGFTTVTSSNRAFSHDESYKTKSGTYSDKAVSTVNSTSYARDATFSSLDSSQGSMNRTPGVVSPVSYNPQGPRGYYYDNYAMHGYATDPSGGPLRRPKSHESLDSHGRVIRASLDDLYKPDELNSDTGKQAETNSRHSSNRSEEFSEIPLENTQ
ncbi:uncharacterized protein LOC141903214 [Tubulanus polymorphus]|uniref:uncharacterized protein LOC141903214 n=1 Tax=Tubulanus polymorphus TaxID=672921 RepID=UPI003DA624D4